MDAGRSLKQRGHAIEARVYAEDPSHGFMPQAGRLLLYREPHQPGVRIDSGVVEGSDVSVYYDPMIAKVIATAETRDLAIARLSSALRAFPILGIRTNIAFLIGLLEHPRFRAGEIDTAFLDAEAAAIAAQIPGDAPPFVLAAIAAADREADGPIDPTVGAAQTGAFGPTAPAAWDPWQTLSRAGGERRRCQRESPASAIGRLPRRAGDPQRDRLRRRLRPTDRWAAWNGYVFHATVRRGGRERRTAATAPPVSAAARRAHARDGHQGLVQRQGPAWSP